MGIAIVEGPISQVEVDGDRVTGVRLADGQVVTVDVAVVSPRMVARVEPFAGIGIEQTPHPAGSFVEVDVTGRASVPASGSPATPPTWPLRSARRPPRERARPSTSTPTSSEKGADR